MDDSQRNIDEPLRAALSAFPQLTLAVLFGSYARGQQRPDSDVDIGVAADCPLTADERIWRPTPTCRTS